MLLSSLLHLTGTVGFEQLFEPCYLVEQLFPFVCIFDTNPVVRAILKERAIMYVAAGKNSLFAALKRLMFNELDSVTVVN